MYRILQIVLASFLLVSLSSAANWAVLVAGSSGYDNYRHQADICHAYQILHKNGFSDSNIVVMMYDDIAHNIENPTKGIVINHPNGSDVYNGVPHDYTGLHVTPKNFMHVLLGEKESVRGVGSEKVLESGPDDNVFVYFADHGATGLIAFPHSTLHAKELNQTLTQMYTQKKYKQMVIYIEACESGSMLEDLPSTMNIYATTASNAEESSYACYYDEKRHTYLGDVYSVVWMEDSDAEQIDKETLFQQYSITKEKTNTSHVMEYGDLNLGKNHNVSEFQSVNKQFTKSINQLIKNKQNDLLRRDAVPMEDVRIAIVSHRIAAAQDNSPEKEALQRQLARLYQDRSIINSYLERIAAHALSHNQSDLYRQIIEKHTKLTEHDCYQSVTEYIHSKCFDLQNEFVLHRLYIMANLCQVGLPDLTIKQSVDYVCNQWLHFDY